MSQTGLVCSLRKPQTLPVGQFHKFFRWMTHPMKKLLEFNQTTLVPPAKPIQLFCACFELQISSETLPLGLLFGLQNRIELIRELCSCSQHL
jgi:hypothetical protein